MRGMLRDLPGGSVGLVCRTCATASTMSANDRGPVTIRILPVALTAKLRAPQVINTLAQALDELVANSIDANATRIDVEVDVGNLAMRVEDNGHGVAPDSFACIAKKHYTSKLHDQKQLDSGLATLGFRGEALASLADISVLQLCSKSIGCFETYSKLLKGSRVVQQGLAIEQRQTAGTDVHVKDFLYSQPVRRRHYLQSGWVVLPCAALQISPEIEQQVFAPGCTRSLSDVKRSCSSWHWLTQTSPSA